VSLCRSFGAFPILAIIALVPAGAACTPQDVGANTEPDRPVEDAPILVRTVAVETADLATGLRATATLESEQHAALSVQAAGLVTKVHVRIGDRVNVKDSLVTLDEHRLRLARDEAVLVAREAAERVGDAAVAVTESERNIDNARVLESEATRNLTRLTSLEKKHLVSAGELDAAKFSVDRAKIAVQAAQLQLERARMAHILARTAAERTDVQSKRAELDHANAVLKAPFAGVVADVLVRAGEQATAGQPVIELADPDHLRAPVFLPQKSLGLLRKDMVVEVKADVGSNLSATATVKQLPQTVDPETGNLRLDVVLDNPKGFLSGMFVTLRLVTETRVGVPVVPKKAARLAGSEAYVYRVREGIAEEVRFTPGLEDQDRMEVQGDALQAGDRIVIAGIEQITDGSKVQEAATRGLAVADEADEGSADEGGDRSERRGRGAGGGK
jgi:multidrug efflux pump subunit AcrA (membrane-fusion protein)